MAKFSAVFTFSQEAPTTATLGGTTSSGEIVLGVDRQFAITATNAFNLVMGNSGMSAASASNFEFPGSAVFTLSTSGGNDRIRIFNPGGTSITYWVQPLAL